jgi:tetratricopeptide (TPR) repeat protein
LSNLIQQSQPPQVALDQIIGLYNQGQLEQTISLAANLAQQYPNAPILYDILGAAYMGLKNADKTIESYKKALQLNPNHTDAYNNMGMALYDQGKFYEAVTSYQKALKIEPDFADAHYNLGNAFKEAGNLKKAIESYKASLAINPKDTEVLLNYGDALKSYGDFDEAIVSYKKALLENPNSADVQIKLTELLREKENTDKLCDLLFIKKSSSGNYAQSYFELGCQLQKNGELKMAITYFDRCLVIDPNYAEAYIFTGSIHQQQNEFEAAISVFYRLLKVQPDNPEVYFYIGAAHQMTGQLEKAMNAYEKALKINPDFADVHLNIGSCYLQWGDPEKAIHKFKKVLRIQPDNAQAYNNLGNAFEAQGALALAIDSFEKAIKVQPDLAEAFSNLGNVLKNKGDLSAAIDSHSQAIKIKPDYADAHNNLGVALKDNGEIGAAINSYKQALKIRPDYAEAYINMGNALQDKGELDAAINSYKQAIEIKPDCDEAYNNAVFSLQATKLQNCLLDERLRSLTEGVTSNSSEIAKAILKYKLDLGSVSARKSLDNVVSLLSNADSSSIKNPNFKVIESIPKPLITEKITALVHFGRSGTGLLHSLIDGHPEVSTLPSIYLSEFFDHSTWKKIIAGGWEEMADRFVSTYEVLFDASSANPITTISGTINNLGQKEGMMNLGRQRNEILSIDKKVFSKELNRLMAYHDRLDAHTYLRLVNSAFDKALNDHNKKSLIFYHIHNPNTYAKLNFLKLATDINWLMMVREPVQSCESWVQNYFREGNYTGVTNRIFSMLFEIDNIIYQNEISIGVRLEDLKKYPKKTIPALCDWMGIKEEGSLYEMTAQGKKWWGDPASPDFAKDGMKPFGKTSINRKVGSVFSKNDAFILRTLFYPFSVRFGYAEENTEQFKNDLQVIRPMLDQMFDFEKNIVMQTKAHTEQFMKSGSYLYLRSGMIERWNTLNEFHTYPNMIRPLDIN